MSTDPQSDGRTLPFRLLHRAVQPYAFAISLYTGMLTYFVLSDQAIGQLLDGPIGEFIGVAAAVTTGLLWWGWWAYNNKAMTHGLLLSAATIAAISGSIFAENGLTSPSAWLAVPLVIASAGAWLLEITDDREDAKEPQ
jgi:hypothetical protein